MHNFVYFKKLSRKADDGNHLIYQEQVWIFLDSIHAFQANGNRVTGVNMEQSVGETPYAATDFAAAIGASDMEVRATARAKLAEQSQEWSAKGRYGQ